MEQFVTTPKAEYHAPDGVQSQLITPLSSPPHVRKQYEACNPPPNLSALVLSFLNTFFILLLLTPVIRTLLSREVIA